MSQLKTEESLLEQMRKYGIYEEDLIEKFILGTGKGGQKINKTSSCVYLKHLPTGIEVKCQKERSQELNRRQARLELIKRVRRQKEQALLEEKQRREKVRRQKRRRTRKGQEENLAQKKRRSQQKRYRSKPGLD